MTYPKDAAGSSETLDVTYNERLLQTGLETYLSSVSYNERGQIESFVNGAGVTTDYDYDPDTFRLSLIDFVGTGAPSAVLEYTYDPVGNLIQLEENGTATAFTYDYADRLTTASGGYSASYSYDSAGLGNLESKSEGGVSVTLAYTSTNDPKHAPGAVSGIDQTYDANGNLLWDGTRSFSYDAENHVSGIVSGTTSVGYVYGPDGQRLKKLEGGATTIYLARTSR
jgi:YD repeat-containing protein